MAPAPAAHDAATASVAEGFSDPSPTLAAPAQVALAVAYPQLTAEGWELGLEAAAAALLATDRHDVWDALTRRFESRLIAAALAATKGRRIEAAQKLGIGRNTITRKIQELGLE
jgi:two-component system nitrogen regulation response regulator GlnG